MAELLLRNVRKTYEGRRAPVHAVKGINLECRDGEFIALLGLSGCGKSTTLRMIAGLETVTSGEILIGGRQVNDLHPSERNVGLAFETYALYPPLTVAENITFHLRAKGVPAAEVGRRLQQVAEIMDITGILNLKPAGLSGGEKARVSLARALIREPGVLLMDEPLSHLDARLRFKMRTELKHLHVEAKTTSILVTHDQLDAMALADRIAIMNNGVIEQFGTPAEVYERPVSLFVASFIGEPPMNLFSAEVVREQGIGLRIPGLQYVWRLSADRQEKLAPYVGRTIKAGIRPEHIQFSFTDSSGIPASVFVFEPLGEEGHLTAKAGGQDLVVLTPPVLATQPGQPVYLTFASGGLHLFDPDTTMAIR
ncbi:MAG TPA: ABC transporter ATP-binding protein [Symbiobacteriaceae bacterium]|nr:ABC transporter ATP-binding protein [Symbiobacteriaceae bacterium]